MKHGVILQILIALLVSIVGAYGITSIKLATLETRAQTHVEESERAIERVKADAEKETARVEKQANEKLDKIDENVQWLIKQQIETRAYIRQQLQ